MANTKKEHYFEVLRKHNVSEYMEQKGQFNYLSWAYAVEELRKLKPNATWRVIKDENGFPHGDWIYYHKDGSLSIIVTYHHGKETYRKSFAPASAKSLGE